MKKYLIAGIFFILIVLAVSVYLLFTGPRMKEQAAIKTFEQEALPYPSGSYTFSKDNNIIGGIEILSATKENLHAGKTYYNYYCMFCHGEKGDGNGPVGKSYYPKPADLTQKNYSVIPSGQLLEMMITGEGHSPVLEKTIQPDSYSFLLLYLRSLSRQQSNRNDVSH